MHEYNKVPSYIDYFSTSGEEIGTWVYKLPNLTYMSYSSEMLSFIHKVYQPDLIDAEYLPLSLKSYTQCIMPELVMIYLIVNGDSNNESNL